MIQMLPWLLKVVKWIPAHWQWVAAGVLVIVLFFMGRAYLDGIYQDGVAQGAREQYDREANCEEETACASMAEKRAMEQAVMIERMVEKARRDAEEEKQRRDEELAEVRAALAAEAQADRARARKAEDRYRKALAISQECRAWSELVVPCPLD